MYINASVEVCVKRLCQHPLAQMETDAEYQCIGTAGSLLVLAIGLQSRGCGFDS